MFIEALLLRVPARFSSPGNGLKKNKTLWYIHVVENHSAVKGNAVLRGTITDKSQNIIMNNKSIT